MMVSNRPDFASRLLAICCSPTPRESMATSEATPTLIPSVVSELRRTDSRRLRPASSIRSCAFTVALHLAPGSWRGAVAAQGSLKLQWQIVSNTMLSCRKFSLSDSTKVILNQQRQLQFCLGWYFSRVGHNCVGERLPTLAATLPGQRPYSR